MPGPGHTHGCTVHVCLCVCVTCDVTDEAKTFLRAYKTEPRRSDMTLAANAAMPDRRKEKEKMTDFIAKKREIFLLQVGYTQEYSMCSHGLYCVKLCNPAYRSVRALTLHH